MAEYEKVVLLEKDSIEKRPVQKECKSIHGNDEIFWRKAAKNWNFCPYNS